jgi:hypothetical protein
VPQWRGRYLEDVLKDIFSSLPFPAGTANIPKNVIVVDVFYQSKKSFFLKNAGHYCITIRKRPSGYLRPDRPHHSPCIRHVETGIAG